MAATLAGVGAAEAALRRHLSVADAPRALVLNAELVLEEMLANVVRHAGLPPEAQIRVELLLLDEGVRITIEDTGPAFDPLAAPSRPPPESLAGTDPGGMGLKLIRRMTAAREYRRTIEGRNRFSVVVAA